MVTYEKFLDYHRDNAPVYLKFEQFAEEAARSGRRNFGAKAVAERLRWYTNIETKVEKFKICNDYISFYARLFEERHPEHKGFFRKRRSIADQKSLF